MPILSLSLSKDDRFVATGHGSAVILWDAQTGARLWEYDALNPHVVISPDNTHVFVGSQLLVALDLKTGKELRRFPTDTSLSQWRGLSVSSDGQYLLSSNRNWGKLWDAIKSMPLHYFRHDEEFAIVGAVGFSRNNNYLATAGEKTPTYLWDMQSRQELERFAGHTGMILSLTFSPDAQYLLTSSADRTVRLWDLAKRKV